MSTWQQDKAAESALACSLRSITTYMSKGLLCRSGIVGTMAPLAVVLTALLIAVTPTWLQAQVDPFGQVDSVLVGHTTSYPGAAFSVPVTIVNDEKIAGFAIPLHYASNYLIYDSASFAGSTVKNWGFSGVTHNLAASSLLLGGVAIEAAPVAAGRTEIVKLYFSVRSDVETDIEIVIDTAFVPPAGRLELTSFENVSVIRPHFSSGLVAIVTANQPPKFNPVTAKTAIEGETLTFSVSAVDPERSAVKLHATRLVGSARFLDNANGNGTFTWHVPYVGTGSSLGGPYVVTIMASDGEATNQIDIPINVVNHNRPPTIVVGGNVTAGAGDTLYIPFAATDPDFETIHFSAAGIPAGAQIGSSNPGYLRWVSDIADSGAYSFDLTATDESGGLTTTSVDFILLPTLPIELSLSDEQAFSGEIVNIDIDLHNRVDITGLDLTIGFDPTVLTFLSADRTGSRIAGWTQFTATTSTNRVFINARSSALTPPTNPLAIGSGTVMTLRFRISSNLQYAGLYSTVDFAFVNQGGGDENVARDQAGAIISRDQTLYGSGGVLVKKFGGLVGDINLNGVAFEIGDVVYFTNYFINPTQYPLTGERLQNSDVNQDGVPGTLGDLILLLRIVNGSEKLSTAGSVTSFEYEIERDHSSCRYDLTEPSHFAAARFEFALAANADYSLLTPDLDAAQVHTWRDGLSLRVLINNPDGRALNLDTGTLLQIEGCQAELVGQEFVDASGAIMTPIQRQAVVLPGEFALAQNYPNPFNPETVISFSLPQAGTARLEVFNVLGETVATLVDGALPAGVHQMTFDGTDASGRQIPSGVYFYRLTASGRSETRKMVLLK